MKSPSQQTNASRHQRRDEGDEDDLRHIYISHILGSVLALLDSIFQTPLFISKGFTLIRSQLALSLRWVRHQHDDGQLHDGVGERGDDFIRPSIAQALGAWGCFRSRLRGR
jgi:hypothetical protein